MIKIKDIYKFIDKISPYDIQESWDNSGLIIGSMENRITDIYISLDIDAKLIDSLPIGSLLITHHPLIFQGLKKVCFDDFATINLREIIKKDISVLCIHTNFDKTHLNRAFCEDVLALSGHMTDGFVYEAKVDMKFDDMVKLVSNRLGIKAVRYLKCSDVVKTVSVVCGSGMSLLDCVRGDCFLTGDIKHHDANEAKIRGVSLIDVGHYDSEKHFSKIVFKLLKDFDMIDRLNVVELNSDDILSVRVF